MNDLHASHEHWRGLEIQELVWADENFGINPSIEYDNTLKITPYSEPGQLAPTIWFEIICQKMNTGGIYYRRINGLYIKEVIFHEVGDAS